VRKVVGVLFCHLTEGLESSNLVFFLGVRGSVSKKVSEKIKRMCSRVAEEKG
jgi:hypothetical protein